MFLSLSAVEYYALVAAIIVVLLLCSHLVTACWTLLRQTEAWLDKHLCRTNSIPTMRWLGSWTWWALLVQLIVTAANLLLVFFQVPDIQSAAQRAGEVAMVNMTLFYLGPHLSYQADVLNLSLSQVKAVHRGATWSFLLLTTIHVAVFKPSQPVFTRAASKDLYGVIAALALAILLVMCIRPLRRPSFELFLRSHQILAISALYATWKHVRSTTVFAQYYTTGIAAVFALGSVGQISHVLFLNRLFWRGWPRARVVRVGYAVGLLVYTPSPVRVRPGQYVNVYMPGVSFTSFLQSHPFYVTLVHPHGHGSKLELLVEPRRGWTSRLMLQTQAEAGYTAKTEARAQQPFLCLFTGPHGYSIDVDDYSVVVLVASGWGLMAHVPYLQALIRGYNESTTKARRIHLIWQLNAIADGAPAQDLLNRALLEDTIDHGYIFNISVYHLDRRLAVEEHRLGQRVVLYEGAADWENLIHQEVTWQRDTSKHQATARNEKEQRPRLSAFTTEHRRVMVMVSAATPIRRQVQDACRHDLSPQLRLVELDYQPS